MKKNNILLFLLFFFVIACYQKVFGDERVYSIKDGKIISFQKMIEDILDSDIVIVGELHDFKEHHQFQLKVIKSIFEKEKNIAIAMEMFRADAQDKLDDWVNGKLKLEDFQKVYYDNWRTGWPLYADILFFSRDNKIPIIGLNVPSEITKKVAQKGFASLTKEELRKLPEGVVCDISETYMNFIKRTHDFHSSGRDFIHFCEAQMLWDKAMAINTINYMKKNKIKKVILLTGKGHAWKHAIPEQIKNLSNYKTSVILPNMESDKDQPVLSLEDADYLF